MTNRVWQTILAGLLVLALIVHSSAECSLDVGITIEARPAWDRSPSKRQFNKYIEGDSLFITDAEIKKIWGSCNVSNLSVKIRATNLDKRGDGSWTIKAHRETNGSFTVESEDCAGTPCENYSLLVDHGVPLSVGHWTINHTVEVLDYDSNNQLKDFNASLLINRQPHYNFFVYSLIDWTLIDTIEKTAESSIWAVIIVGAATVLATLIATILSVWINCKTQERIHKEEIEHRNAMERKKSDRSLTCFKNELKFNRNAITRYLDKINPYKGERVAITHLQKEFLEKCIIKCPDLDDKTINIVQTMMLNFIEINDFLSILEDPHIKPKKGVQIMTKQGEIRDMEVSDIRIDAAKKLEEEIKSSEIINHIDEVLTIIDNLIDND